MYYPNYLVHFNKLHSKSNGQFISGDGDSDGVADEHHRYTKSGKTVIKPQSREESSGPISKESVKLAAKVSLPIAKFLAGKALCLNSYGKAFMTTWKKTKKYANLEKIFKDVKVGDLIGTDKLGDKLAEKTANKANELYTKYGG